MAVRVPFWKDWKLTKIFKELANIAVVENVFSSLQNICYNLQGRVYKFTRLFKKAVPNMIITATGMVLT